MIRTHVFKQDGSVMEVSKDKIAKYLKDKTSTVWIDVQQPTEEDYQFILKDTFSFHQLSIEDCKIPMELPKIDVFDEYVFIVFHNVSSEAETGYFKKAEVDFFLGENYLVSFHLHRSKTIEYLIEKIASGKRPFKRGGKKPVPKTADFLLYQILDNFVDRYFPLIDVWDEELEDIELKIISNKNNNLLLNKLLSIKRELLNMRQSIVPQRDVLKKMSSIDFPFIRKRTVFYFKDLYDHIMLVYTELEILRDLINNAFEAHTSMVNNQMTTISNQINQVMQKLTIMSAIFLPLTFITGLYGMNFIHLPGSESQYGFAMVICASLLISGTMLFYFRKNNWL